MAGQRINIMELRQLIQLKQKGMSNRAVGKVLGMSRNTVNSYVKAFNEHGKSWEQLRELPEAELALLFPQVDYKDTGRYEQLAGYFPGFAKEMQKTGCTLQTLWAGYLETHPDGYRYTQFVHYFNRWSNKTTASGILIHIAGEKLFIDFAGKTLSWVDRQTGEVHPVQVFVAILPTSQYTFVRACEGQKREDVVQSLNECLEWIGGVINKTLKDLALHYDCVIDPTRPYHPRDKALVEGAVALVYQRIYYPLSKQTFFSLAELNDAIRDLLTIYNDYRFQNRTTTRREQFLEIEQAALAPLPPGPYQMKTYKRAKVQKIAHVYLGADKNYYSVPHRYIGRYVEVQYTSRRVEIFYQSERIASHPRSYRAGHYTTTATHMPSTHQAYSDWNPEKFVQRAATVGPYAERYIRQLIEQYDYPEIGYKQAQGILAFTKSYSSDRLEAACRRACGHHRAGYRTIANILANNLDQLAQPELSLENRIPDHRNIRGGNHYK